jgi:23S rRNA pseudouridine2605 synthase
LTSEQLLATRATLWRQKAEPLLTLDDAKSWIEQTGLSLFLPRKAQIPAPAPSFVEACLGETNATPPRAAIETAQGLLTRLIEANSALPLNLLGAATNHPDFLVSIEALPFVYALRGDRDWKHAPGTAGANRVSPLVTQVWKLLEKRGVLTAIEIQEDLGRELTEAAVLRALHELWSSLRVIPLYQENGQETLWEPLQSRYQKAMNTGSSISQVTALSVLTSVYLQSVIAASGDDAESFLSPLASRSKVREVVRGLAATRQLSTIQMETQSLLYVEGSLPEFPETEKAVEVSSGGKTVRRPHPTSPEGLEAALARKVAGSPTRPAYKRPAASSEGGVPDRAPRRAIGRDAVRVDGGFRPAAAGRPETRKREGSSAPYRAPSRPVSRPRTGPVERSGAGRSEPGTGLRADGSPKKTRWRDMPGGRPDQKGKPARFGPRKSEGSEEAGRPAAPRRAAESLRPASGKPAYRPAAGSRPAFKSSGPPREGKPYRSGGDRPARAGSYGGSRPPARSGAGRSTGKPEGARPTFRPRREEGADPGDRRSTPRPPRAAGFSSARPREGGSRPYTPRSGSSPASGKPASGRPFTPGRSPYRGPSATGGASSTRSSSSRPSGGRSFSGKPAGRGTFKPDYKPRGAKPGGKSGTGSRPSFGQRPGGSTGRPPAKFKKRPESPE